MFKMAFQTSLIVSKSNNHDYSKSILGERQGIADMGPAGLTLWGHHRTFSRP